MVVGGDVLLPTPLAPAEAPFVWLFFTLWALLASCLPLVWVFRNKESTGTWLLRHNNRLPWLVGRLAGVVTHTVLLTLLWLFTALSFWVSRGGHLWNNRIAVEIVYYFLLAFLAAWTVPVLWSWWLPSSVVLALGLCLYVGYTVAVYIALPWYAGFLATMGCFTGLAIVLIWSLWTVEVAPTVAKKQRRQA